MNIKKYTHNYSKPATVAGILYDVERAIARDDTALASDLLTTARVILDEYLADDNVCEVDEDDMCYPCYVNYYDLNPVHDDEEA